MFVRCEQGMVREGAVQSRPTIVRESVCPPDDTNKWEIRRRMQSQI